VNYESDETNANIMSTLSVRITLVQDNLKEFFFKGSNWIRKDYYFFINKHGHT